MRDVSNSEDILDSRDIEERISELESIEERDEEEIAELHALIALRQEAEGYSPDWKYGATLIRDSYFQDYAQELADDICGEQMRNVQWPLTCIDWEQAARELQMDYTSVEFDGVTYWVR